MREVTTNDRLGSREVSLAGVEGVSTSLDLPPEHYDDDTIGVAGFTYDDEPDVVQLTFGGDVRINVTLSTAGARELADKIATAADEADADLEGGE